MNSTEPLLGFRWWQIVVTEDTVPHLASWIYRTPWNLSGNTATHLPEFGNHHDSAGTVLEEDRMIPSRGCSCGFYGWYRLDRTAAGRYQYLATPGGAARQLVVPGAFIAAGHIIHHPGDHGFRCEWAKPIALMRYDSEKNSMDYDQARKAALPMIENIGLPVLASEGFEEWCREWGELWREKEIA